MALPRGRAQVNSDVRLGILFRWDDAPTDPHEVRQAEIIDTDGQTVLDTITDIEHEPGTGEYYVVVAGAHLEEPGRHIDRWAYTWVPGESEQTATQDFYVQETAAPAHYGPDLQVGVGYLKGFPELAADAQDGIVQGDLDRAMNTADAIVASMFADAYDIDGWVEAAPPLVAILWEMLAAAKAIEFRDLRLGLPADEHTSAAAPILRTAHELAERILHGRPERLHLRRPDGTLIRPRRNRSPAVPRAARPTKTNKQ